MVKEDIFKEDIIREAQKLFQLYGLKKTTMEDIAKALGKGKSTLYYYYQSKELIFEEVLQRELQEVFRQTQIAVESVESAEEKLKVFAVTRIKVLSNMLNLYRLVCGEFVEQIPCGRVLFNEYSQLEINLIRSILLYGIEKGEFNQEIEQEMDLLPSVVVSSIRGIERDFFNDKLVGLENRIGAISNLFMKGLKKTYQ
ncbi:TetR/AcrR family transcriptional regulator [Sediminibacterium sp. C3]|uniref:TetR/AcrR family transcriptional regulator n=1 Tax=Sediminibacterium sp. C3 TaxID=1267211 RepID=UPI00041B2275|nr:TetR/AcrR family transcriptional regulator [Sediminibacterium sp. C3]